MPCSTAYQTVVCSKYDIFEALPASPYHFVIWNVYLTDKLAPLTTKMLQNSNIAEILAILPEEADFQALNADLSEISYTIYPYHHSHEPNFNEGQYKKIAEKINHLAKRSKDEPRNVLVFCNNGYQRSIPFLVYYMTKYHADEFSTIDSAVNFLLSRVGNYPTFDDKLEILKKIELLFCPAGPI